MRGEGKRENFGPNNVLVPEIETDYGMILHSYRKNIVQLQQHAVSPRLTQNRPSYTSPSPPHFLTLDIQVELMVYALVENVALPLTASVPAWMLCSSIPESPLSNFSR